VIDREALVKSRLAERVVDIPGVGELRIRSLSGKEVAQIPGFKDDVEAGEEFVLVRAVVDPVLSPADVRAWREAAPHGELAVVLTEVFDLSGLGEEALKEAVKSLPGGSGEAP
jgi:hypothetical protein